MASRDLLGRVRPGVQPGRRWSYCTADSQVLDWVRERATGLPYADDVAALWRALGCTSDAYVAVDGSGDALAGGGLAATARDWSRVARLAVDGRTGRQRLLDADWVEAAARPAYPFLAVGRLPSSITTHAGFGYHWWPMDDAGHRVTADGSRGQFACADRRTGAVVVKTFAVALRRLPGRPPGARPQLPRPPRSPARRQDPSPEGVRPVNHNVIITCALTGAGDTVGHSEHVPVTPKQIAASGVDAAAPAPRSCTATYAIPRPARAAGRGAVPRGHRAHPRLGASTSSSTSRPAWAATW